MSYTSLKKKRSHRSANCLTYSSIKKVKDNNSRKKKTHKGIDKRIFVRFNESISNSTPSKKASYINILSYLSTNKEKTFEEANKYVSINNNEIDSVNEFHTQPLVAPKFRRNFSMTQSNKRHIALPKSNRQRRRQKGTISFKNEAGKNNPLLKYFNKAYIK